VINCIICYYLAVAEEPPVEAYSVVNGQAVCMKHIKYVEDSRELRVAVDLAQRNL
jgi:hypothetical protein